MMTSMVRPTTARRLRKNRLATIAPGERTLTRRSSFKEYCCSGSLAEFFLMASLMIDYSFRQEMRTRGSTTAYRISERRLLARVMMARNAR